MQNTPSTRSTLLGSCAAAALTLTALGAGTVQAATGPDANLLRGATPKFLVKGPNAAVAARFAAARRGVVAGGVVTVPYWTSSITSPADGQTYTFSMVGSSPYSGAPSNTNVTYVPVVLRIHVTRLSNGQKYVIDPTQVSHCDTQSASRRFFNSPIFRPITSFNSNGVNVAGTPGGQQLISAFQRANFWGAVHGTNYGVTLVPSRLDPIVVDWTPTRNNPRALLISDDCGGAFPIAEVDINDLNNELLTIAATYGNPTQIPTTLVADTAIYQNSYGNCCVLGYHNAVPVGANGVQTYAIGAYFTQNSVFGPHFADTTVWAHELSELMDDPFVQSINGVPGGTANASTPAWGPSGQVYGCQNNLETGDPLTPDQVGAYPNYPVTGVGGFVYHTQDLGFHDWYYRTASTSTGGKYSFLGNFTHSAGPVCGGGGGGGGGVRPIL